MVNYSHWDLLEEIRFEEAVCLWCEIEPYNSPRARRAQHPESVPVERFLLDAYKKGELPIASDLRWLLNVNNTGLADQGAASLKKADLRKLAEDKNVRPRFLFPEGSAPEIASATTPPTDRDDLGRRIEAVLNRGADLQKLNSQRSIASVMVKGEPGRQFEGFGEPAIRKILAGTYDAATRRGFRGLDTWIVSKKN